MGIGLAATLSAVSDKASVAPQWGIVGVSLLVSPLLCLWLYPRVREHVAVALDIGWIRQAFDLVTVVLLPLLLGAWADIVDITEIFKSPITWLQAVSSSLIIIVLGGYCTLYLCSIYRQQKAELQRAGEQAKISELKCQRNYLFTLLEGVRKAIASYQVHLEEVMNAELLHDGTVQLNLARPEQTIRGVVEAVWEAYRNIDSVPNDSRLSIVLFKADEEFLLPAESFDGTTWSWFDEEYHSVRDRYFKLDHPTNSCAVAAFLDGDIKYVEDAEAAHTASGDPFTFFYDRPQQRTQIGSLVAIPINVAATPVGKYVLCIACSSSMSLLRSYDWKALRVQSEIEVRLRLLHQQQSLIDQANRDLNVHRQKLALAETQIQNLTVQLKELDRQKQDISKSFVGLTMEHNALSEKCDQLEENAKLLKDEISSRSVNRVQKIKKRAKT